MGESPNKNSGHRGSGKLPCLVRLRVSSHMVAGRTERCQILYWEKTAGGLVLGTVQGSAPDVTSPF